MPNSERHITDADIEALKEALVKPVVAELRAEMTRQFYDDLGRGIWSALKTLAIAAALALAAWGYKVTPHGGN